MRHFVQRAARTIACASLLGVPGALRSQAPLAGGLPGKWAEVNALYQPVTNDYGDWRGTYARAVLPGARDTWYVDALGLDAFGERGAQVGFAQRHDWTPHLFQLVGGSVGSGASILPRARADASLGVRFGRARTVQTSLGFSYVKSVTTLYDLAGVASIAVYAPHGIVAETGVRYNVSRPGDIQSQRIFGSASWTPTPTRSLSARVNGGNEGYQIVRVGTLLVRFASQDYALAWREKITPTIALSLQGDLYRNPFYTRSGVTLGVARYW